MSGKTFPNKTILLAASAVLLGAGVMAYANKSAQPAAPDALLSVRVETVTKPVAAPAGSAGWIYREPGSALPQMPVTRGAIVPRIQAAKDPRDGISMTLPPLTASVATVDAKGHVDYDCKSEDSSKTVAAHKSGHGG